jgi:hypothetical protein
MKNSCGIEARAAKVLCTWFLAAAAVTMAGCGGGDTNSNLPPSGSAGPSSAVSATPVADTASGTMPLTVTFNATNPKGSITKYEWNMRDNSPMKEGQQVQHTFMEPGSYDVTLTVRDAAGRFNNASLMVNVGGGGGGTVCQPAPALFTNNVWPALNGTCLLCHASGRVAAGTGLVFVLGGTTEQNYNVLRTFASTKADVLLGKTIGLPTHDGGKPFVDANSQQYKDLAALVPVMASSCTTAPPGTPPAPIPPPVLGQFWAGVTFQSDAKTLAKASVLFAGRNPTTAEYTAVQTGGLPMLRQTIRGYMDGPAFDAFLNEAGDTHFLTGSVVVYGNNRGLVAADWPTAADVINNVNIVDNARNRLQTAIRREPIELIKYIVKNNRPFTEAVNGRYTVANGVMAQYLSATVQGSFTDAANDNEWRPATLPSMRLGGTREQAGVLSTHAWLDRFPTTPTNRNRHRVYIMAQQFLGTDVAALAARPIDDGGTFRIPTMENPGCAVCHDTIDPMAAGWQNWDETNRFQRFRDSTMKDHALPGSYRANNYPRDAANMAYYRLGDSWFRDQKAPGYGATPMPNGLTGNSTALQWLSDQVVADQRFPIGAVHFWYTVLFNKQPLKAPLEASAPGYANQLAAFNAQNEEFQEIAQRFTTNRGNGAYNVRDLLVDLVMSRWTRAEKVTGLDAGRTIELGDVGQMTMLNPAALNRKLISVVGGNFAEFDNPFTGFGLTYGNFDGNQRTERANEHTTMQTATLDRLASVRGCQLTQADFNRPVATRLLFPNVALTDTPATAAGLQAITNNVVHLHKWLWKDEAASASDPEVQRTLKLYQDVWADRANAPARPVTCAYTNANDPNYTGRAWVAVLAYMIGDPDFVFE